MEPYPGTIVSRRDNGGDDGDNGCDDGGDGGCGGCDDGDG